MKAIKNNYKIKILINKHISGMHCVYLVYIWNVLRVCGTHPVCTTCIRYVLRVSGMYCMYAATAVYVAGSLFAVQLRRRLDVLHLDLVGGHVRVRVQVGGTDRSRHLGEGRHLALEGDRPAAEVRLTAALLDAVRQLRVQLGCRRRRRE